MLLLYTTTTDTVVPQGMHLQQRVKVSSWAVERKRDADTVCLTNNEKELNRYSMAPVGFGLRDQDVGQEAAAGRGRSGHNRDQ